MFIFVFSIRSPHFFNSTMIERQGQKNIPFESAPRKLKAIHKGWLLLLLGRRDFRVVRGGLLALGRAGCLLARIHLRSTASPQGDLSHFCPFESLSQKQKRPKRAL